MSPTRRIMPPQEIAALQTPVLYKMFYNHLGFVSDSRVASQQGAKHDFIFAATGRLSLTVIATIKTQVCVLAKQAHVVSDIRGPYGCSGIRDPKWSASIV